MMARNIETTDSKVPAWDPSNLQDSLDKLYAWVDGQTSHIIHWYYENKTWKAIASRTLRLLAILLGAAGALIPVFAILLSGGDGKTSLQVNQYGYLALGLAALCIALDRFYGYSTGWMRFIHTAMLLEGRQEAFRLEWSKLKAEQGTDALDMERLKHYLDRVETFVITVRTYVQKETEEWMAEFQSNLTQLQQETTHAWEGAREEARKKAEVLEVAKQDAVEEQRPGAIQVTLTGDADLDEGMLVEIDGKPYRDHVTGKTCGIAQVPPGIHEVALTGLVSGKKRLASSVVLVEPNKMATVSMELR